MNTIALAAGVIPMADVNLRKSWSTFWKAVQGQAGPILNLLAVIGVLIVVGAIIKWAWDRRRGGGFGGGGNSGAIWGALLVGCLLSAPSILIPMFLLLFDVVANAGIDVFESTQ